VTVVRYDALGAQILATAPRAGVTRVVAIDGPAGSGKTTFAARLARAIGASVVHTDDICPGWEGLESIGSLLIGQVLSPLWSGGTPRYQRYDWDLGAYGEWREVPPAATLLVEGVNSGLRAAASYLSVLLWVEAPFELRLLRGLQRDGEVSRPRWQRWMTQEDALFIAERTRERADVRVDGGSTQPHDPERAFVTLP
jgi:uridine kinase